LFLFAPVNRVNERKWAQLIRAQAGIMLLLLPLAAWWFQTASTVGFVANLAAIPWVSLVVVPLILLGLITMLFFEPVSAVLFWIAGAAAEGLLNFLGVLAAFPVSSLSLLQPTLWGVVLATIGALVLFLPRGFPHRWLGLLLFLPLYAPDPPPADTEIELTVLDAGQGTALLLRSKEQLLVYDSGPGNGVDFDLVDQVIRPGLLHSGLGPPDRILISHADLDHAGGMVRLQQHYPQTPLYASLPLPQGEVQTCQNTLSWNWGDIAFNVLHPSAYLPYLGNNSSCVLSIRMKTAGILLPGDISSSIEHRLVDLGIDTHTVLLVPHHGSNTSSSAAFLNVLKPSVALATAGLGNRFGFPRPEVRQRYMQAGIPLWSTGECGAIKLVLSDDGVFTARSARRVRHAPWRWPASDFCP